MKAMQDGAFVSDKYLDAAGASHACTICWFSLRPESGNAESLCGVAKYGARFVRRR